MSESLPYDEIKFEKNVKLEDVKITLDDSKTGFFVECGLKCPDGTKEKTKCFFSP